jgi:hypothetical protein
VWAVAFSDANTVQVFDGRIPIQEIAAPAGTVASVALIQSPGTDSVGVATGTTTNLKFVQPSVNLREAMAHQYKEPIHVGETVVVDSAGIDGIFWTGNDATYAGYNAGRNHIFVRDGTYESLTIPETGLTIECDAPKHSLTSTGALFNGGGNNHAVLMQAGPSVLKNCGVYTAPSGGGGAYNAIDISGGAYGHIIGNVCINSDADCLDVGHTVYHVTGNTFLAADEWGIHLEAGGDWAYVSDNWFGCTNGLTANTGSINSTITGNTGSGTMVFDSGSSGSSVTGNANTGAITDNGSNTIGNN